MTERTIERETLIAASVQTVWDFVSKPGWWAADAEHAPDAPAVEGESSIAENAEHGDFPIRVEAVEPPTFVAYRWVSAFPGEDLRDDNSTLVEFTLTAEGDKTRLRVVESGFDGLPTTEANRQHVIDDHTSGWVACFDYLRSQVEH